MGQHKKLSFSNVIWEVVGGELLSTHVKIETPQDKNILQACVESSLRVTWVGWWQGKPWEESFPPSSTSSSLPCRWILGIISVIYFSKDGNFVSRIPKTIWQRLIIPGQPGRHRLLVLPDSIHLRRSFSGEPTYFTLRRLSRYIHSLPGCLLRCPDHSVFHLLCRDWRGATAEVSQYITAILSWTKTNNILARDLFELFLFSISGSPLGDVTTSIRKCWRWTWLLSFPFIQWFFPGLPSVFLCSLAPPSPSSPVWSSSSPPSTGTGATS